MDPKKTSSPRRQGENEHLREITSDVTDRPQQRDLALPHERDESPGNAGHQRGSLAESPDVIEQAAKDVHRGLVDTEIRGTPSNVPDPQNGSAPRPGGAPDRELETDDPGRARRRDAARPKVR